MGKRILVPVDDSEHATGAVELVCSDFPDAEMVLLHVINPAEAGYSAQASLPSFSEEWYEEEKNRAERLFEDLTEVPDAHGVPVEEVIEVGKPTSAIVDYATENAIDHIVMGSHGREGVSRILLGSVAETVVRRSPVPVTVTR